MSPHIILLLFLTNLFHINAFEKSFTLNPNRLAGPGIGLYITDNHVTPTPTDNGWHIDPQSQSGTDLELLLDNSWGFHSSVQSSINITINGFTPNITKKDGEILMLFAVNDIQYFSMEISLQQGQAWKSYPEWNIQSLATSNGIESQIVEQNEPPRYFRTCNSPNRSIDNWKPIGPSTWYKTALQWPLHIQITNDPINNKLYYKCFLSDKTLTITYQTSFNTKKGMTIYIMNDASDGKPFDIYSIDVSYTYTTLPPTIRPTNMPTMNTISPTQSPNTYIPSTSPTTPSPIIIIGPNTPTHKPNTGEQIDETMTSTTDITNNNLITEPTNTNNNLMMYLLIIIIVLICCFAIVCIGFIILYKKKKNHPKFTAVSPTEQNEYEYNNNNNNNNAHNGRAIVGPSLNMVPSISSAVIKKYPKKYSNISMTNEDFNMDFNNELQNLGAGNDMVMEDIVNDMATRGADNNDLDDEFAKLNNMNEYAEGNNNGHSHQKTLSNSNVMEGNMAIGDTIGALSSDEKLNSLKDERTQNMCLNAVDTHGGDIIINDDYETIK